jgi:undecaprenyl diphosphate synthase
MAAGPVSRSLKRFLGHQQGANSVQLVTETASRIGLPWLTLYAFSLENNLRRPRAEVNFLMRLLKSYLESNLQRMMDNNVRMKYIGRTHDLPPEVQEKMRWAEDATAATPAPRSPWPSTTAAARNWWTPSAASPPR